MMNGGVPHVHTCLCGDVGVPPWHSFEEKWLKSYKMNLFYFRANMALFELILGALLVPVVFLPVPGQPPGVTPSKLPAFLDAGLQCFLGVGDAPDGEACDGVWLVWLAWIAVGGVNIYCSFALVKYGSAVLSVILAAVGNTVGVFFYQWPALAGPVVQHGLAWNVWVAVFVSCFGGILYATGTERSPQRSLSLVRGADDGDDGAPVAYGRVASSEAGGSGWRGIGESAQQRWDDTPVTSTARSLRQVVTLEAAHVDTRKQGPAPTRWRQEPPSSQAADPLLLYS